MAQQTLIIRLSIVSILLILFILSKTESRIMDGINGMDRIRTKEEGWSDVDQVRLRRKSMIASPV